MVQECQITELSILSVDSSEVRAESTRPIATKAETERQRYPGEIANCIQQR
jgi:hypothetical protein